MEFILGVGLISAGLVVLGTMAWVYVIQPWRRSWNRGKHVLQLTESEKTPAPEYGSMSMDAEEAWRRSFHEPFADDYRDWLTQTFDSLSPEALDRGAR
jgi:hypothetical protein